MIRDERDRDRPALLQIIELAFGGTEEVALVERLYAEGAVLASVVAEVAGELVGHALLSRLDVMRPTGTVAAAALAPVAVAPAHQRRGLGQALVRLGVERCAARGVAAVVVVGHADYYPRLGFSAALARSLEAPFAGPSFMALELAPGALAAGGRVAYAPAFALAPAFTWT